ncbi:MAG: SOS response-associated peptidase family protein [Actinobacteria bacterium]|nr:SOS response-associated peptidase family protein [Actinomycetota bacterium]
MRSQHPWARAGERPREMINVKAETAIKGGPFRKLLDARRIAIPTSHFYEWRKEASGAEHRFPSAAALPPRLRGPAAGRRCPGSVRRCTDPDPGR